MSVNKQEYNPPMQISVMAERLNVDASEMHDIIANTIMEGKKISNAQFTTFLAVANEYKLNPLTKEIYAFPTKNGGIQPIVSIDGWLKIINQHPQFDGMKFIDTIDEGKLISVTCKIYRKDRTHPTEVTEYMNECAGPAEDKYGKKTPWGRWPSRLLRHKSIIQAARYAFGLSGIIDPDEAERYEQQGVITKTEKEINPTVENPHDVLIELTKDKDQDEVIGWLKKSAPKINKIEDLTAEQAGKAIIAINNGSQKKVKQ